jgi:nitrite reductase/ring-hydroxylating ferredoxin subunit
MNNKEKLWKQDFPISRPESNEVSRRDFARILTFVSGGMVFGNAAIAARAFFSKREVNSERQKVCTTNDLPIGGTKSFVLKNSSIPYILVHTEDGEYYSYEQKCTHLSCAVYYRPGTMKIECPCHNGWFDVKTGEVIQGPPPRPLNRLDVIVEGKNIFVQKISPKTV